jgi:hypothetical protein
LFRENGPPYACGVILIVFVGVIGQIANFLEFNLNFFQQGKNESDRG